MPVVTISIEEFEQSCGLSVDAMCDLAIATKWEESEERQRVLDDVGAPSFRWVKALDVVQWHLAEGESLARCAEHLHVTKQRAHQCLRLLGDAPREAYERRWGQSDIAPAAAAKIGVLQRVFREAVRIVRNHPGIDIYEVCERTGADSATVRLALGDVAGLTVNSREGRGSRGRVMWSDEEIFESLRTAASDYDGALSKKNYMDFIQARIHEVALPSSSLVVKRFGSWNKGLAAAGLGVRESVMDYSWATDRDEAVAGLVRFIIETALCTKHAYQEWSSQRSDSLSSPHHRISPQGRWSGAVDIAFDKIRSTPSLLAQYQSKVEEVARRQAEELSARFGFPFELGEMGVTVPRSSDPLPGEES